MLVREIRTFRPDAVLAGDPEVVIHTGGGINHTDHRAAAMAAVDAVYPAARNPMAFSWLHRQGLPMHKVRRVYLMWSNQPNVWIDVSSTAERKIEALRAHASQLRDPEAVFARVRTRLREQGEQIGTAAGEAYRLVVLDPEPETIADETADVEEALTSSPTAAPRPKR